MHKNHPLKYIVLYFPFILAYLLAGLPHLSYLIAWTGSFYIFYLSFSGKLKPIPTDLPIRQQLLRPVFLLQVIYAGYMASSSIFYYVNALGFEYFTFKGQDFGISDQTFSEIARCQCYYVLGHAALTHGIIAAMRYPVDPAYQTNIRSASNLLLKVALICLPISIIATRPGPFSQYSVQTAGISFVAGTLALAYGIIENRRSNTLLGGILFAVNLFNALISGFKEPIIVCVLLLGIFLLPVYGKKIYPLFGALLIGLFLVLPTFIGAFRKSTSSGADVITARNKGFDAVFNNAKQEEDLQETNWAFLTNRLSEISMFIQYTESSPSKVPFYGADITLQAVESLFPRVFWPSKPNTERVVMERAYKAGVVSRTSIVSAKPAYIVDAYLSAGAIGIAISTFLYGFAAQRIALKAESLFGGYLWGTALVFTGLFQIFWRGNSFEFVFNSVFWSYVSMYLVFYIFRQYGLLIKK